MRRVPGAVAACLIVAAVHSTAQQQRNTAQQPNPLAAASAALGATTLKTIRYSGFGSTYSVGQNPDPLSPWPRVDLKKYEAAIDYGAAAMQVDITREQGPLQPRGGGQPFTGEQRQLQIVSGGVAWNVPYGPPPRSGRGRAAGPASDAAPAPPPSAPPQVSTPIAASSTPAVQPPAGPQPAAAAPPAPPPPGGRGGPPPVALAPQASPASAGERAQQIWSTPHGFLKAALENTATTTRGPNGAEVSFVVAGRRFNGVINARNEVERVRTWMDSPVLGDMLVETTFSAYETFDGVSFPTHITQRQGGYPALDLFVATVQPNSPVAIAVPDAVRNATPPPAHVEVQKVATGVYYLTGGTHHSVAFEMADHVVLVEAPLNEERSITVMSAIAQAIPNKPIRFVVNTHHHFDHSGGLRTLVDAGATVVTHVINKRFYDTAWAAPRTIGPDRLSRSGKAPVFVTFTDKHVLADASRTIEIHRLASSPHHDGFAVVYLPAEKLLIEADAYTPADAPPATAAGPPPGTAMPPGPPPTISPATLNLYQNLQRLKLDVTQIAALHGPRLASIEDLARAAGVGN